MKLTVTSRTYDVLPAAGEHGQGFVELVEDVPTHIHTTSDVVIIGDKPSFVQALTGAIESAVKNLLHKMHLRKGRVGPCTLVVDICNECHQALRVILGDGRTDVVVAHGETYTATSLGYIEIREFGLVESGPDDPLRA